MGLYTVKFWSQLNLIETTRKLEDAGFKVVGIEEAKKREVR